MKLETNRTVQLHPFVCGGLPAVYVLRLPSPPREDLGQALPTRIAVGRAMFRGRYRPESDSYTAPRADSRAR